MNLELSLVPVGNVSETIPSLLPYLRKSEIWDRGRTKVDDILRFVLTGQMQLWVVFSLEEQEVYGYLITEVKQYSQCKMLVIQYCCIEDNHMQYVEDKMQTLAEKFAKDFGCAGIEFVGRPGWGKHISKYGYDVQSVVYQRFFKE
jgi:hypothetical protein